MVSTASKFIGLSICAALFCAPVSATPNHAIATHGDPKYPPDFKHFDYVNPNAPQGGEVTLSDMGGFDSLNPFIVKGSPAPGAGLLHCSLMSQSSDEPSTLYAYTASKIEVAPGRDSVVFTLNPEARFSDGSYVTAQDVVFSFNVLREKGAPLFGLYYRDVKNVEIVGKNRVKFTFVDATNRELPMILGQMPLFSEKYYKTHDFAAANLDAPVGCGPYRVEKVNGGSTIKYKRVKDWWGNKVPSQVGHYNFDTILYKSFRDMTVMFEAFKSGDYDFRTEYIAKNWAHGYAFPAVKDGKVVVGEVAHEMPQGMQLYVFNTRRNLFKDPRVRLAFNYAFDYEWVNENLFFNAYKRSASYFENSDLAARDLPEGEELAILEEYRGRIPEEVFTTPFVNPKTNGSGNNRKNLAKADKLLREAGWIIKDGKRVNAKTGEVFKCEFLIVDPSYERVVLAFKRNVKRLGIQMTLRTVSPSQYAERVESYDFDIVGLVLPQTETPGNEQRNFWGSEKADAKGSFNMAGIKDPVVDELIEKVIDAQTREQLVARTRALDRVLLWGHYGVPGWHLNRTRMAHWDKFQRPKVAPKDGIGFITWWIDPAKEKALNN